MIHADFSYTTTLSHVFIKDLNRGGLSVTNNAENVLSEINSITPIIGKKIYYRDSNNLWDEMIPRWSNITCTKVDFHLLGFTDENLIDNINQII